MENRAAGTGGEAWRRLADRFGSAPLVRGRPVVRAELGETVITAPAAKRVVLGLLLIACGNGVPAVMWLFVPLPLWRWTVLVVGLPVAGLFTLVGLSFVLYGGRLSWRPGGRDLGLRYGWLGFRKQAAIPSEALRAELSVGQGADSDGDRGSACLHLCRQGRPRERLQVASGSPSDLHSAYQALAALLGGRAEDRTVARVQAGGVLHVSKLPLPAPSANFRTVKLTLPSPDKAVLKATLGARAFFLLFLVFGLGAFCLLAAVAWWGTERGAPLWAAIAIAATVGTALTAIGLLGLSGRLGTRRIDFDRHQGVLWLTGPSAGGGLAGRQEISLEQIAALQVCCFHTLPTSGAEAFTAYQLNLVFRDPPGERLHLMSHNDEASLRTDARRLAEFLGKPLLDHSRG